jgi:hypothetical protein
MMDNAVSFLIFNDCRKAMTTTFESVAITLYSSGPCVFTYLEIRKEIGLTTVLPLFDLEYDMVFPSATS